MVTPLSDGASTALPACGHRSLIWRKTFPGTSDQPGRARRELADALQSSPYLTSVLLMPLDDIKVVTSELCTNAVIHTRSGLGGTFKVEVTTVDGRFLMVAVTDDGAQGSPSLGTPDETDTHYRGLQLVNALSSVYGFYGDDEGRTVWAAFTCEV